MGLSSYRRRHLASRSSLGFTLIEVLIVVLIIGIITAVLVAFSADSYRKTQLRDGASQMIADLNRARSQAQRSSTDSVVSIVGAVGSPDNRYTTTWAVAGTTSTTTQKTLPAPIRVAPYSAANSIKTITYSAPYGEVGGSNAVSGILWEISSLSTSTKLYVKAVGVTGKVILSATPN